MLILYMDCSIFSSVCWFPYTFCITAEGERDAFKVSQTAGAVGGPCSSGRCRTEMAEMALFWKNPMAQKCHDSWWISMKCLRFWFSFDFMKCPGFWMLLVSWSGWWFQTFLIFHNVWDNPSHWLTFFMMFFDILNSLLYSAGKLCSRSNMQDPTTTLPGCGESEDVNLRVKFTAFFESKRPIYI